jgi:hypothetical protein
VPKNLRDLIHKPNETGWSQMAALYNVQIDQNIPKNTVIHARFYQKSKNPTTDSGMAQHQSTFYPRANDDAPYRRP